MTITGNGINTVTVNGKVKHITELDDITLCLEWTKLREENNRLYEIKYHPSLMLMYTYISINMLTATSGGFTSG